MNGLSTPASSSGALPSSQSSFRVVRKRNRVPLSCSACRSRKLKCNRGQPCDNCIKRDEMSACSYTTAAVRKRQNLAAANRAGQDDMQNRIDRLEDLVLSLMTSSTGVSAAAAQAAINNTQGTNSIGETSQTTDSLSYDKESEPIEEESEVEDVSQGVGLMKVDGSKVYFASDSHWMALLANIAEVKNYYTSHRDELHAQVRKVEALQQSDEQAQSICLFTVPRIGFQEIMKYFPQKAQTDVLIGRYFNSYDPAIPLIHGQTFQKRYDAFWHDQYASSVPFVALLFAMMTLALQSYYRAGDEPGELTGKVLETSVVYRRLTAQALLVAGVSQPIPEVLEALILHTLAESARARDTPGDILILSTLLVRLAVRMGYNRDSTPHPDITPFQGELRRRTWMIVRQIDIHFSIRSGLPTTSRDDCSDTQVPRNLHDDELDEHMTSLPPSRPDSEATIMTYAIAKSRLTDVFGRISNRICSITSAPIHEEIMDLDSSLKQARATLPPYLMFRSLHESANETRNLIVQRYSLELIYLKAQCVLHRRYICKGRDNPKYAQHRRTCIDASMDLLAHQAALNPELGPGGRLHNVKWFMGTLAIQDFVLANMIVCLELYHSTRNDERSQDDQLVRSPSGDSIYPKTERREEMFNALHQSLAIWQSMRDTSIEAWKASTTLRVMLEKLELTRVHPLQQQNIRSSISSQLNQNTSTSNLWTSGNNAMDGVISSDGTRRTGNPTDPHAEQAAAMTLGMLSSRVSDQTKPYPQSTNDDPNYGLDRIKAENAAMGGYPVPGSNVVGAPGPYTQMFGIGEAENLYPDNTNMETNAGGSISIFDSSITGADVDWGAWDSFIQGATIDPLSFWDSRSGMPNISTNNQTASGGIVNPAAGSGWNLAPGGMFGQVPQNQSQTQTQLQNQGHLGNILDGNARNGIQSNGNIDPAIS